MSIVSGSLGAVLGAKSQNAATAGTERNVANTNAANMAADIMARGGAAPRGIGSGRGRILLPASVVGTSSAVLPYYFGGAESELANASTDLFNASFGLDSTRSMVPTSSNQRYADPVNGAANVAADRARLARLEQQLTAMGDSPIQTSARGDLRKSINALRTQLTGATPAQARSGVNPGIGQAINDSVARDQAIVGGYEPQVQAGDNLIKDLFNGDVTQAMLDESAPVRAGRVKLANMERDAGIEALQDKLNEIRTIQAKKGYSGDSLAKNRLDFDARRRIGTDAARAMGGAELENAMETQRIKGAGRDLTFRSLDVPFNRAGQRINLANLPTESTQRRFSAALQPLQFFRTGGANFNIEGPPERSSVPSAGQIALTGLGATNSAAANYFLRRPTTATPTVTRSGTVPAISANPSGFDPGTVSPYGPSTAAANYSSGVSPYAGAVAGDMTYDWMDEL